MSNSAKLSISTVALQNAQPERKSKIPKFYQRATTGGKSSDGNCMVMTVPKLTDRLVYVGNTSHIRQRENFRIDCPLFRIPSALCTTQRQLYHTLRAACALDNSFTGWSAPREQGPSYSFFASLWAIVRSGP